MIIDPTTGLPANNGGSYDPTQDPNSPLYAAPAPARTSTTPVAVGDPGAADPGTDTAPTVLGAPRTPDPTATTPPPASTPPPSGGGSGGGSTAQTAEGLATSPDLDTLLQQMIAESTAASQAQQAQLAQTEAFDQQEHDNIESQYETASQPVDPNDPILKSLDQTHDAADQQAVQEEQEAMAAAGATQGTPTGASDADLQSSYEAMGKDNAAYAANTQYTELQARRTQIGNLLQLGAGVLSTDEQTQLQTTADAMDAQLKALGLASGAYISGTQVDNQNTQFYDGMSNNDALQTALMNQYLMENLTGASA